MRHSKETIARAKVYFYEGKSLDEISDILLVSKYTIRDWKKKDFATDSPESKEKEINIEKAKQLRLEGKTCREIADIIQCNARTVNGWLKNIILTDKEKFIINSRTHVTYKYNSDVFTREDTLSLYLLGVYLTDGCMKPNRVALSSKDKEWLADIKNIICNDLPLSKDGKNCWRLDIFDPDIVSWLLAHECVPKKSCTLKFPDIPREYIWDFLRGVIDGDGCIAFTHAKGIRKTTKEPYDFWSSSCSITSASINFIEGIAAIYNQNDIIYYIRTHKAGTKNSIIDGRVIEHKNDLYDICVGYWEAKKLLENIYRQEHCFSLGRKKEKANSIINHYNSKLKLSK